MIYFRSNTMRCGQIFGGTWKEKFVSRDHLEIFIGFACFHAPKKKFILEIHLQLPPLWDEICLDATEVALKARKLKPI
jgi:hypothetical protein